MTGFRVPRVDRRHIPLLAVGAAVLFALAYVLLIAQKPPETGGGSWRTTTFGSAVDDPASFLRIFLDSITFAGALFIVAGVIANMHLYFQPTTLFNTLVMLVLLVGGLGLIARSIRPHRAKASE